jgi:hypothetical protein
MGRGNIFGREGERGIEEKIGERRKLSKKINRRRKLRIKVKTRRMGLKREGGEEEKE